MGPNTTNISTTSPTETECQYWSDPTCDIKWWDVIGPIVVFLILFIFLVVVCKCFLASFRQCCDCCYFKHCARRRNRSRSNQVSSVSEGVNNDTYREDDPDLPPSYSSTNLGGVEMFRVATIEDLRRSSVLSEKLPTYDDIIKQQEAEYSGTRSGTSVFVTNETISVEVRFEVEPSRSRDGDRDPGSVSSDSTEPPSYEPNQ